MKQTFNVKSVMLGRKPREDGCEFKTLWIRLFMKNNPHKCGEAPIKTLEIPDIEKVRIRELRNVSYYLEGNDIVINNLTSLELEQDDTIMYLRGVQELPEE